MLIDLAIEKLKGLISFFETYRESGFNNAINVAKNIEFELGIDATFPQRREIRKEKHFDEVRSDVSLVASQSPEVSFKINFFLYIIY